MIVDINAMHWQGRTRLSFPLYPSGITAILGSDAETGEPAFHATVNDPERFLRHHLDIAQHVLVKTWSENVGLFPALVRAGVLIETGDTIILDYGTHSVTIAVGQLTDAALAAAKAERGI